MMYRRTGLGDASASLALVGTGQQGLTGETMLIMAAAVGLPVLLIAKGNSIGWVILAAEVAYGYVALRGLSSL